ncbi:MAG: hypothetical protein LBP26_07050 [Clostridiales bacterium]|nr:hypothetical protein [Clostridiales bacterium]
MAFEPIFEAAKFDSLKRLCSSQAVVEAKLMPSSGVALAKILSIATDVTVSPGEVFAGEARYAGRVSFKVIFTDPDGAAHSMDYNADFTDKLVCDDITAKVRPSVSAAILDTDIVAVDEREIKLACVVEVNLDAVVCECADILVKGGENVYTHEDRFEYSRLTAESAENFTVSDVFRDVKYADVLLSEPRIVVTGACAGVDCAVVEGKIICDLVCECEDNMLTSYRGVTPFTQEVAAPGAEHGNLAVASASVGGYRISPESDGDSAAISADYTVVLDVKVFSQAEAAPVTDAFSVTHELLTERETLKICRSKLFICISDRVDGAVTLDQNMPLADNILAVTGSRLTLANVAAGAGKVTFEGVASCSIIYYAAESDSKNSVAVELPFSFTTNAAVREGDEITAKGIVTAVAARIRRGNEIDIKADIEIEMRAAEVETRSVITRLALGEERALPTSAFGIHVAKGGETLWDVAKALGTTPEIVLLQNPKLSLPLSGGERVIAYRHLK